MLQYNNAHQVFGVFGALKVGHLADTGITNPSTIPGGGREGLVHYHISFNPHVVSHGQSDGLTINSYCKQSG